MMSRRGVLRGAAALAAATAAVQLPGLDAAARADSRSGGHWVGSWTASPTDAVTPVDGAGLPVPSAFADQSLRMIVTPHLGGPVLRVRLTNRFGTSAVRFGRVTAGLQTDARAAGQVTPVTFGGQREVTVPAGQDAVSDPVPLRFGAFTPLAISMYLPGVQATPTKHWAANATSFYAPPGSGDLTASVGGALFQSRTEAWFYVAGVDVTAAPATSAVVAFGDSITDGWVAATPASVPDSLSAADRNGRYPDCLQRRIIRAGLPLSVVNAGISANRLVTGAEPTMMGPSGLQRFRRDALSVPGIRGVLLQEGINDLGIPPATTTPGQLIDGYEQVIAMARAAGVKLWLGTLLPASDAVMDGTVTAPHSEEYRQQVNTWIRHQRVADGVVDFDAALRDPSDPSVLNPRYSSADHLHPSLAGYQAMADTVDLDMLR